MLKVCKIDFYKHFFREIKLMFISKQNSKTASYSTQTWADFKLKKQYL